MSQACTRRGAGSLAWPLCSGLRCAVLCVCCFADLLLLLLLRSPLLLLLLLLRLRSAALTHCECV